MLQNGVAISEEVLLTTSVARSIALCAIAGDGEFPLCEGLSA